MFSFGKDWCRLPGVTLGYDVSGKQVLHPACKNSKDAERGVDMLPRTFYKEQYVDSETIVWTSVYIQVITSTTYDKSEKEIDARLWLQQPSVLLLRFRHEAIVAVLWKRTNAPNSVKMTQCMHRKGRAGIL